MTSLQNVSLAKRRYLAALVADMLRVVHGIERTVTLL
jgi:hypothetical protein